MDDPFKGLYDKIACRKNEARETGPYTGGNGRIDRAVDLILYEDFPRSGTLMDIGGATGNLGYALRDHFETRVVLDIADDCREPAEAKGNRFYRCNIDADKNFSNGYDGSVDLIVALDFIEHIIDPEQFARGCHRLLRSGGRVLINTPNIQFWRHLESLVVGGHFPHTSGDQEVYHGGHVAFFNEADLRRIFSTQNGFVDQRVHVRGLRPEPPPPIWMTLASYPDKGRQLSYADLIFSARKP